MIRKRRGEKVFDHNHRFKDAYGQEGRENFVVGDYEDEK